MNKIDKTDFNIYCADLMYKNQRKIYGCGVNPFVPGDSATDGFSYYNPFDDLNLLAEVVEKLLIRKSPPKPMWSDCVWGEKLYGAESIKQIFRDFVESTK